MSGASRRHSSPKRYMIRYPMTVNQCENVVKVLKKLCTDCWQACNKIMLIIENEADLKAVKERVSGNDGIVIEKY